MSCGASNNNQYAKSCVRYYNNSTQELTANGSTLLTLAGAKVVNSGISIEAESQSYTIVKPGLYHIAADVTVEATTAGAVTLTWYKDGVALPCTETKQYISATHAGSIHAETDLRLCGCCQSHSLTLVATTDDAITGNVSHVCSGVVKLA